MAKLTTSQVASRIGVSIYTINRWYNFWNNLAQTDIKQLNDLVVNGMPALPKYEVVGTRGDRIWDELDITELEAFKEWVPHTKNGIFKKFDKGE